MSKVISSLSGVLDDLKDGDTLLIGGFGLCGIPENCIREVSNKSVKDLTVVSCTCGVDDAGIGILLSNRQVRKVVASYVGENKVLEQQFFSKELEIVFTPQGTLAEQLRAGGVGVPAFYTPVGIGTSVADGKEEREFEGRKHLLEYAIKGDFGLVKARKADTFGNLVFSKTARNYNPLCAMASRVAIAEVEEIVPLGELDPDEIHLPGIFVQYVYQGKNYEKRIERRVTKERMNV